MTEKSNPKESTLLMKKHSPPQSGTNLKYPYFTNFPPFNRSFYKPKTIQIRRNRYPFIKKNVNRKNYLHSSERKPLNILRKIVTNSIRLFNPQKKKFKSSFPKTKNENIKEKFDISQLPHLPIIPDSNIFPLGNSQVLSQEYIVTHLVLVSIPLLFTG